MRSNIVPLVVLTGSALSAFLTLNQPASQPASAAVQSSVSTVEPVASGAQVNRSVGVLGGSDVKDGPSSPSPNPGNPNDNGQQNPGADDRDDNNDNDADDDEDDDDDDD